mmetsp:Transcript_142481/g.397004  ORF Transcript_142481/g.397004 Transcript_142481/m.397004 type:complete len:157 (-) Transcript_142481:83-553(-)
MQRAGVFLSAAIRHTARAHQVFSSQANARWCSWHALSESSKVNAHPPIRIHDGAVQKLKSLQEQKLPAVLRLTVNSGGCSGYSYEFSLVATTDSTPGSLIIERDGTCLVVDEVSLSFLEDCEVDYVEEMIRSSFQVVKNNLADSKCGCGNSFNIAF